MPHSASPLWAIVPAAGIGRRMATGTPKQYLPLHGRTVIEWALAELLANDGINGVVVALGANDAFWPTLTCARHPRIQTTIGGSERAASVLNALTALSSQARDEDWVLVHDAARPCLSAHDLSLLITSLAGDLAGDSVGGLLATPVSDTLKFADPDVRVSRTISRESLWRALTPQMFRFGLLQRALLAAAENDVQVTDESSAIEALGFKPRLIAGSADNIKITVPEDLPAAERILQAR